ncbi:TonB-dependent receptor [Fontimonas sp. SYSU GA230001]|uniref:TonB-dependent receptor plug domain-containing protein n=1 Tax=Fontimonas sp. SYSU GA230001 TaxID=3142450 RepID=UPI0032B5D562
MELCASLSMLMAVGCWLRAALAEQHAGHALEWQLLGVPFTTASLLAWTGARGDAGLEPWWPWLGAAGLYPLRVLVAPPVRTRGARAALASIVVLGTGLPWSLAFALETLATITVPTRTIGEPLAGTAGPDGAAEELDAIVVTGTRTEHRLGDSPVDVQLITATDIHASGARDLAELLEREGGLHAGRLAGRGSTIEIQGLSSEHVLILVDGRRMIGRINGAIDLTRLRLDDVERIEIVKGPSSALYGADALGGVINVITRRRDTPGTPENGALTLRGDADGNVETFANSGWALGPALGGRASAGWTRIEPFDLDASTAAQDGPAGRSALASANARWSASEDVNLDADFAWALDDRCRVDDNGSGGMQYDTHKRIEELRAGLAPRIALGGATELRLDVYYHRYLDQFLQQRRGNANATIDEETLDQLWGGGVQLDHGLGLHRLSLGLESQFETLEADRLGSEGRRARQSLFTQDELTLLDGDLALVPGLRYDRDSQFGDQLSPKLSLRYAPARDWILRAGYGHGYRAPDFKQLLLRFSNPAVGYRVDGNPDLEPERSVAYHLGVTWFANRSASVALSSYHSAVEDLIEIVQVASGPPVVYSYRNVSSAQLYGADLQTQFRPLAPLRVQLGYGWLHSEDEASGEPLSGRPARRANAALRFEQKSYALGLRGVWVGKREFSVDVDAGGAPTAAGTAEPYTLFDLRGDWTPAPRLTLSAGIDNLFDAGDPAFLPIQPRTSYLEIRWSFR